jgi:hypothetical protein
LEKGVLAGKSTSEAQLPHSSRNYASNAAKKRRVADA